MKFHIQYLSTRSGKSLLLFFDKHRYVFNLFEGFQRYSIESNTKLSSVTAFFLSTRYQIPALLGTYLTLNECKNTFNDSIKVVCSSKWFDSINLANFANKRKLKMDLCTLYEDTLIKVKVIEVNEECSFVIELPTIRGKMLIEKIPKNFPRKMLSLLAEKKEIFFEDNLIKGVFLPDVMPKKVAIIYCTKNFEELKKELENEKIEIFIFLQENSVNFFKQNFSGEFYFCKENSFVEFNSFYQIQKEFNNQCKDYLLPMKVNKESNFKGVFNLESQDILSFNKSTNSYDYLKKNQIILPDDVKNVINDENYVLFLGTGCAIPSKYRNVSSILVKISDLLFLFDCGEDTLYQIHRVYGSYDIINELEFVFLSHSHADHVLGIIHVLKERKNKMPLKIFGPSNLIPFISSFLNNFLYFSTDKSAEKRRKNFKNYSDYFTITNFHYKITVCGILHCLDSCGVRIDYNNFSISYSGDCKYDLVFREMVKNCDFLIHEATFSDDLKDRAEKTFHSTTSDALKIAKEANVSQVVLTHFSQRKRENVLGDTLDFYKIIPKKFN